MQSGQNKWNNNTQINLPRNAENPTKAIKAGKKEKDLTAK